MQCPEIIAKLIKPNLDKLIELEFKLRKDHSEDGGPNGWYDNEMARWENKNKNKKSGTLFIRKKGYDWVEHPEFREGRQDYWSGFAMDYLIGKEIPGFEDQGGHEPGSDHALNLRSIQDEEE